MAMAAAQTAALSTATTDGLNVKPAHLLNSQTTSRLLPMLAIRHTGVSHSDFNGFAFIMRQILGLGMLLAEGAPEGVGSARPVP